LQQDHQLTYLKSSKPNALACFLAAQEGRLVSRTRLLSLFWEDAPEPEARRALTTTLGRIQRTWPGLRILTHGDAVGCALEPTLELDIDLFSRWQRGEGLPVESAHETTWLNQQALTEGPAACRGLSLAAALYRGEFMAEFNLSGCPGFDSWLTVQRQFWEHRCIELLSKLNGMEAAAGAWVPLAGHARQALAILPHDERFRRTLMQALAMQGDRAGALAQYESLRLELSRDLRVEPEAQTRALRKEIAQGTLLETTGITSTVGFLVPVPVADQPGRVPAPMVGRTLEARALRNSLFAERQEPRLALVTGELGTGKSRLVSEVVARAPGGLTVLTGHCYEDYSKLPYAPIVQVLRAALPAFRGGRPPLDEVWLAEVARLLPELSTPKQESARVHGEPDTPSDPLRLCEAVARFVATLPGGLIFVLEDLHWADEASLLVLTYLLRSVLPNKLQIAGTIRSAEASPATERLLAQLEREHRVLRIHVTDLTLTQVAELTAVMVGSQDTELAARVFAETNGHPFFTTALIETLAERRAAASSAESPLQLPGSVEALIYARLARFPAKARQLAVSLAIFPQGAALSDLALLTGLSEQEVGELVEPALKEGILHELIETGSDKGVQVPGVRFGHELVRRTLLGTVSQLRQRGLHSRAFDLILARLQRTDDHQLLHGVANQLNYHATAAHRWEEAERWSLAAAQSAERVFSATIGDRLNPCPDDR